MGEIGSVGRMRAGERGSWEDGARLEDDDGVGREGFVILVGRGPKVRGVCWCVGLGARRVRAIFLCRVGGVCWERIWSWWRLNGIGIYEVGEGESVLGLAEG